MLQNRVDYLESLEELDLKMLEEHLSIYKLYTTHKLHYM